MTRTLDPAERAVILDTLTQSAERNRDLLCSFSLLPFNEASDALGRRVASTYIVAQVTIRNRNKEHEFLLHDVQALLNGNRFYATHDRRLARGVAEVGQAHSARNVLINSTSLVAASVGGAAAILSNDAMAGSTLCSPA